jgi:hypothetical protein
MYILVIAHRSVQKISNCPCIVYTIMQEISHYVYFGHYSTLYAKLLTTVQEGRPFVQLVTDSFVFLDFGNCSLSIQEISQSSFVCCKSYLYSVVG